jgi:hypothetical protein
MGIKAASAPATSAVPEIAAELFLPANSWNIAVTASATAAVACIGTWTTDFRADLPKIDVPMLVLHGDADNVLPIDKTGRRLPGLVNDLQLVVIKGGPHAIPLDPRRPGQHRAPGLPPQLTPPDPPTRHAKEIKCLTTSAPPTSSPPATMPVWT